MDNFIFSVSKVNEYVRGILSKDPILKNIYIKGEISNFKLHSSGHMYFSLKDEEALIRCVMFRQYGMGLDFMPKNGMSVVIQGYISVYSKDGQYQCYVQEMRDDGLGMLFLAFEAMKRKLYNEGLFDDIHKKRVPYLPHRIAVVTSNTGAAIRDIIQIATRRFPNINILVVPVSVQGKYAAGEIAEAIDYLNTREDIDLIITGRGGGSIEELWAFNEECVARSIFRARIPVISAVGHETDFTIADFVADLRAPTPSAAAELAVPQKSDVLYTLMQMNKRMETGMEQCILRKKEQVAQLKERSSLRKPKEKIDQKRQELDHLNRYLEMFVEKILTKKKELLGRSVEKLHALSPLTVLGRGYSIVEDAVTQKVIKSVGHVTVGQKVSILMKDGTAKAVIQDVHKNESVEETDSE